MRSFTIAGRKITQGGKPFVIAEVAANHNGRVDLCKILFDRAKANGADAVKLQKRNPSTLFTKKLYDMPYENDNSFGKTYGEHREKLEFSASEWEEIVDYARKIDIILFSTAFDVESLDFLEQFDLPAYKVASGCLKDIPLIEDIAGTGKPIIISTGGGTWEDIDRVVKLLAGKVPFCFLHCVAAYPNQAEQMNLSVILSMLRRYPDTIIGLSDHYPGNLMAETAYCLGARVFEKHFTANKAWQGPDHALSMEPEDLRDLVHDMERIKAAMGNREKFMLPCEEKGIYKMGKSLFTAYDMKAGDVLYPEGICIKSPADGLPPYELDKVIGRRIKNDMAREEAIIWDCLI